MVLWQSDERRKLFNRLPERQQAPYGSNGCVYAGAGSEALSMNGPVGFNSFIPSWRIDRLIACSQFLVLIKTALHQFLRFWCKLTHGIYFSKLSTFRPRSEAHFWPKEVSLNGPVVIALWTVVTRQLPVPAFLRHLKFVVANQHGQGSCHKALTSHLSILDAWPLLSTTSLMSMSKVRFAWCWKDFSRT